MTRDAAKDPTTILAANIKSARVAAGLTQRELARLANDIDPQAISRWERAAGSPSNANLMALVDVLGRDLAWFYTDHDSERVAA